MDWNKGYSARYYISVIDRKTLRDIRRIEITDGSIKREDRSLRESANLECVNYDGTTEELIRVWLDARQEGDSSHIPLFTGIATSPGKKIDGRFITNTVECYSILKIVEDMLLPRGWYAPKGMNSGDLISNLLSPLPVHISIDKNSPGIDSSIIAEDGENRLSMTDKILDLMQWRMRIDGRGDIFVEPFPDTISAEFDSLNNDILEPSLTVQYDWYECPNVYRAVLDNSYAIARDDSPDSPLSTVNRGREVWYEDSSVYLQENQSLAQYAQEMLAEAQRPALTISYDRRFHPDVGMDDLVRLNYPAQEISGIFLVTSQTINLGYNAKTSEEVVQV